MLPDYDALFGNHAEKYDRFVAAEDFQGNLLQALKQYGHLNREQAVADLGTGTGRIAFLVAPIVRHVYGIEPVGGMRLVAESKKLILGMGLLPLNAVIGKWYVLVFSPSGRFEGLRCLANLRSEEPYA